jgi:hypothetical protein
MEQILAWLCRVFVEILCTWNNCQRKPSVCRGRDWSIEIKACTDRRTRKQNLAWVGNLMNNIGSWIWPGQMML